MPRLKPPPAKPEILLPEDHTPPVDAVEIELSGDEPGSTEVELAPQPAPEPQPAPKPSDDDALVRAADATRRAEELQRHNVELQNQAREREEELTRERGRGDDAEYNSVLTAIAAEQSTLDKAESDYATFAAQGDWAAAGKAQRVMSQASSRLDRLEEGKQSFDTRREALKTAPPESRQPAAQPPPQDLEQKIAALGVPDTGKTWLRKHPEFVNDTAMNKKIGAAHNYLTEVKGVEPFSTAYFDALDDQFGFKTAPEPAPEPRAQPQTQRRSMPLTAPVSRDVPTPSGQRESPTKITLTAEERQIARTSFTATDMTNDQKELLYARNKQKLQRERQNGAYPQPERN